MRGYATTLAATILLGLTVNRGTGQGLLIDSFHSNGYLTWTNAAPNSRCRVEWAASLDGPWIASWQNLVNMQVSPSGTGACSVPMFYRVVSTVESPQLNPLMFVGAGDFSMGDGNNAGDPDERPVHTVFVSDFWIEKFEVTRTEWVRVYDWALTNGYTFSDSGTGYDGDHPVQTVCWYDCVKWCNARSEKEGLTPVYYTEAAHTNVYRKTEIQIQNSWVNWTTNGYRLPTEAEWEKAARGSVSGRKFPWGNTIDGSMANYRFSEDACESNTPVATTPVGYFNGTQSPAGTNMANGFGVYDMAGNIREWCWDYYQDNWYSSDGATTADTPGPLTANYGNRLTRGGDWFQYAPDTELRCARRNAELAHFESNRIGFRCVRRYVR